MLLVMLKQVIISINGSEAGYNFSVPTSNAYNAYKED